MAAFSILSVLAQGTPAPAKPVAAGEPKRPRIALVLGGGGARGGAHLGVLEVLEELNVPIDCVAGTSMGSLVGGAYAAGVSPKDIRDLVEQTDWNTMFDDATGREDITMRNKTLDDRFYGALEFGVSKDGVKYREGALAGEKIKLFFNRMVRADLGDRSIEQLRMPLALLATDIGTGERVVMRSGNLTSAMRASMSVPGLMSPVVREGHKLVDGGLTDNVPIAEARALCKADVVIAVNVGSPLFKPEDVSGLFSVVGQMVNLLTEQNVARSLAELKPTDIYMRPELGDINSASFTRLLDAAKIGRETALRSADQLRKLSAPKPIYLAWQTNLRLSEKLESPKVDAIEIEPSRYVSAEMIRGGITQKEGEPLDESKLAEDLVREMGHGDLHSLDYSVVRDRDRTILKITPVEKPWGPNFLRFGINIESDMSSEATYNVRALFRSTWLNKLGGEFLAGLQIGSQQGIAAEFYQPLDPRQTFFVRPYLETRLTDLQLYEDNDRFAIYQVRATEGGLELGSNLGVWGQVRAGWAERQLTGTLDTGPPEFPNAKGRLGGVTGKLSIDTQDQPFFPTRGVRLEADYFDVMHTDTDTPKYSRFEARLNAAYSVSNWVILGNLEGGFAPKGEVPLFDAFTLGGPRRLAALATDQMRGGEYIYGKLQAQYRLNYVTPLYGLALIGGVTAEAGRMNKLFADTTLTGWQNSFGAYIAAQTPIGPMYLGIADSKTGKTRFYLFVGTP